MTFEELKRVIYSCKSLTFIAASDRLQEIVFALNKADTLELISYPSEKSRLDFRFSSRH